MDLNLQGNIFCLILMILPILSIVTSVVVLIKSYNHYKRTGNAQKLKYNIMSVGCTVIAIISWLFNMGMIRFCLIFTGLPFIHSMIFVISNSLSSNYAEKYDYVRKSIFSSCITYVLANIMPDAGDYGGLYALIGLENKVIVLLCFAIASISILGNIVYIIFQFSDRRTIKNSKLE